MLRSFGRQALLVTHSPREARKMSTSLFVMQDGHIIRHGNTEEVFRDLQSEECEQLLEE
ncbi:MAG: hypothetical protein SPF89_05860 [Sphaerochaetaceae bacterium]|nr:hypothetical protein [Spirochaetales bacterium]MDY5499614.1 hypothetical protein [Sphaerochaetaceae bacterium]